MRSDVGMTISFPGEYESHGIEITGFPIADESTEKFLKTAYKVIFEEMTFVFLGHLSRPLDASLMEEFSEPDVLILPVGGGHFLEPEVAAKMAKQLEARIVMPSFYKNADDFLKALGRKTDAVEKFVFRQKDILTDKGRPVVLKASVMEPIKKVLWRELQSLRRAQAKVMLGAVPSAWYSSYISGSRISTRIVPSVASGAAQARAGSKHAPTGNGDAGIVRSFCGRGKFVLAGDRRCHERSSAR